MNLYEVRTLVPSGSFEASREEAFNCWARVFRQE